MKQDKAKLDALYADINKIISSNDLSKSDEDLLVDLINKIKTLGL